MPELIATVLLVASVIACGIACVCFTVFLVARAWREGGGR